jgi:hypothetical protein
VRNPLLPAIVLAAISAPAFATLTFFDPFNYPNPDGSTTSLSDNTDLSFSPRQNWFRGGVPTTATNDPKTNPGNLSYPGLPASTGNSVLLNNTLTGQTVSRVDISPYAEGSTVYYSLILNVTDLTGLSNTTTGSFFTGLQYHNPEASNQSADGMTSGVSTSMAGIDIHYDAAHTAYNLGIANRDAPAALTRVFDTTPYTTADTLFLVVKCVVGPGNKDDAAYLYINPSSSTFGHADPNTPTVSSVNTDASAYFDYFYDTSGNRAINGSGQSLSALRSLILRNNSVEPAHIQLDELRVGTTWADVTRAPIPGDANDDGRVDRDDYSLIDRGFSSNLPAGTTRYADGDFNFDGAVDQSDYLIIDQAFIASQAPGFSPGSLLAQRESEFGDAYVSALTASIPEPTLLVPLAACLPVLPSLTRRRRR